jgi:starch synthase (maltosyl-transferring)
MNTSDAIFQQPPCGSHHLMIKGDELRFRLRVPSSWKGRAWLRTNLGHAATVRREIIRCVEHDETPLGRDWFDIPMQKAAEDEYRMTLGLFEVGHFEGKCYFLSEGKGDPVWPPGPNTAINVQPADSCCANIVYNAFVRQFGPGKSGPGFPAPGDEERIGGLDHMGYTVIPPSGTFRDLIKELDFIIYELGCRIVQLLPIHPTPTTYARMGRFGSPYAALSFTAVDPALAQFDPKATPLEQFIELVDAIHSRQAKIFLDIAINHTGWAAALHETHPQWLLRDEMGEIKRPGAWGVTWADLTRLDYSQKDLWTYMAEIFLTWCRRGADGFRCDAGYMIPVEAWKYIIAKVRDQFPDTIFLLEGLGGEISVSRQLLNSANFNWAYSELFQSYDRGQIENYLPQAMEISHTDGVPIHFAETHDNIRLAATSPLYARLRTALCALVSHQGAFGFANGVEWLAKDKIDVHASPSLNWGAADNQVAHIRRINTLLSTHPAFFHPVRLDWVQAGEGNFLAIARQPAESERRLLILVNLDHQQALEATWDHHRAGLAGPALLDLLSGLPVAVTIDGNQGRCQLAAGQVLCLSDRPSDLGELVAAAEKRRRLPERVRRQQLQAKVLEAMAVFARKGFLPPMDMEDSIARLSTDPLEFCRSLHPRSAEARVVVWQWPQDVRREVMLPPGHFLLIRAPHCFRAAVSQRGTVLAAEQSLAATKGGFFALFMPLPTPSSHRHLRLKLAVYAPQGCQHANAPLLCLAPAEAQRIKTIFGRSDTHADPLLMLATNGRGAMLRVHADWRRLNSRYDALLAANLNADYPEDRRILLTRFRGWVVYQGFSIEINPDCLDNFGFDYDSRAFWQYHIPTGQGEHVLLSMAMEMGAHQNRIRLVVYRHASGRHKGHLPDGRAVRLIFRPDIEDRSFHETTKAYLGPENSFGAATTPEAAGFRFQPHPQRCLTVRIEPGEFHREPEWHYMVQRPLEAERGLDPNSDLFSPGYFACQLKGDTSVILTAAVESQPPQPPMASRPKDTDLAAELKSRRRTARPYLSLPAALDLALGHYVVRRSHFSTVIAGYPWFLDWGRDTLIVARGLIAAGRCPEARAILEQFARFEQNGTLPNMIRGQDASNRDTSDAPLWFFTAAADLVEKEKNDRFLDTDCGGRSLRRILIEMAGAMIAGTPNGIRMDPASGLIYSPAHFTWMDTNYPAGSPRMGYPIEIQALWHAALAFLDRIDASGRRSGWKKLADRVGRSIVDLFYRPQEGYLADCLHASAGTAADKATPDDALRPNQLFAVTLSALRDPAIQRSMLTACQQLLVPGAIRSLADRPVHPELSIIHNGHLLNDPRRPYQGRYTGDEDTRRKPAYHNGTAWTWVFPSFCEAWVQCYGPAAIETALAWLTSATVLINTGCAGHVPEIVDGDYPHHQRGCDAQAWGVSELLRVWLKLSGLNASQTT